MGRIRTIKPEFPQSESIGRLSRDARLLFIMLWTFVDDSGKSRAASRLLATQLYPYDDDAPALIDDWLLELEEEGMVVRYEVDGSRYLLIPNWLKHQKIEKPSNSKLPEFTEASRIFSEPSVTDLGPVPSTRTMDQGDMSADADLKTALEIFNAVAEECGLPKAQAMNRQRKAGIKARMKDAGGLEGWRHACERIKAIPWMLGENKDGWRMNLDSLITTKCFTKLMEGAYDRSGKSTRNRDGIRNGFIAVALGENSLEPDGGAIPG